MNRCVRLSLIVIELVNICVWGSLGTKLESRLEKYKKIAVEKDKPGKEAVCTKCREKYNPQILWEKYKTGIMKASKLATQACCKELAKI